MPSFAIYGNAKMPGTGPLPTAGYVGPGDVVAGAAAWWGLRAYSTAKIGTNAVRLRASGDNAESDFVTLANGSLDVASIGTFLTGHGGSLFVTTLYDQTGNAFDLTQTTAGAQPAFTLAGLGSLPVVTFITASSTFMRVTLTGIAYPFVHSHVAKFTGSAIGTLFSANGINLSDYRFGGANLYIIFAGAILTVTVSDNVWHAIQSTYNGTSSEVYLDGVANAGEVGAGGTNPTVWIGADANGASFPLDGLVTEVGFWFSTLTSGQKSSLNTNQHSYWGF